MHHIIIPILLSTSIVSRGSMCYHLVICATYFLSEHLYLDKLALLGMQPAPFTLPRDHCTPQWMLLNVLYNYIWFGSIYKTGNQTSFITLRILLSGCGALIYSGAQLVQSICPKMNPICIKWDSFRENCPTVKML